MTLLHEAQNHSHSVNLQRGRCPPPAPIRNNILNALKIREIMPRWDFVESSILYSVGQFLCPLAVC
ncbi:hypothetical protein ASPFODRAFT_51068 [Aspergillus luchuensis CBS 106.47]|uniref:Uncharacterized protein n=1 Tax=Aspergillus luchuensis (strain CBS 106.47) TaxID=1137211 RepID=A0A1M3T651_ASPLC|nr:hypothetical protein ASPFODRAFT_51068 [Aspergillus luchuensis CBS 106.47]